MCRSTEWLSKKRSRCLTTLFLCCRTQVATIKDQTRRSVSGSSGRLLTVVHVEVDGEYIRIISARRDEAEFDQHTARKLAEALKRRGVAESLLEEALAEVQHAI